MMRISAGDTVQIMLDPESKIPNDPRKKLNRQTFEVKRRKDVMIGHVARGAYFELDGAVGANDEPYVFLEEELYVL